MITINLISAKVSQRPITGYQVLCKSSPDTFPHLSPSLSPALMERLLGKSPLRLVARRTPLEKGIWKEVLECGHVTHTFVDFFWDEKSHLVLLEPTAKRRRCHNCRVALDAALPSPKKPCQSTKRERRKAA